MDGDDKGSGTKVRWVAVAFRVFHLGLCAFMCVAAIEALEGGDNVDKTDRYFVAAYIFLLAVILGVFEISCFFKPAPTLETFYKNNLGFIYKPISKGVFLIFVGFLQFGLNNVFGLACGILTIADGIVLQLVYCKDPNLLVDVASYNAPNPTARQQEV